MNRIAAIAVAGLALSACEAELVQPLTPDQSTLSQHATATGTHFSTFFQATAICAGEIGRIRFSGIIEGVDHATVDANGETHRTRHFRVKGLNGENLDFPITYRVIGGAEMLTWNTQIGQVPGVAGKSIHAGTLVFNPVDGGSRVVAHHAIRLVESATGELVVEFHEWRCQAQG